MSDPHTLHLTPQQDVAPFGEVAVVTSSTPMPRQQQQPPAEEEEEEEDTSAGIAEELALDALATLVHEEMLAQTNPREAATMRGPSPLAMGARGEVSAAHRWG